LGKSNSGEIQELILGCLEIITRSYSTNMRSGWRTILSALAVAAHSAHKSTIESAFGILEYLLEGKFDLLMSDFVEVVNCLTAFAGCSIMSVSEKTLHHMSACATRLAATELEQPSPLRKSSDVGLSGAHDAQVDESADGDSSVFRLWWPLLMGLSTLVGDSRLVIRLSALSILKDILLNQGAVFRLTWGMIFKGVLFPMVESAKLDVTEQPQSRWPVENPNPSQDPGSWVATTASAVFTATIEVYCSLDEPLSREMLPEVMGLLEGCVNQDSESLARLALRAYNDLLLLLGGGQGTEGRQGEERPLNQALVGVVATRTAACMKANLGVDFGPVGILSMDAAVPTEVADGLTRLQCPLRRRRPSALEAEIDATNVGRTVSTPFGEGVVAEALPSSSGVAQRQRVVLSGWTASLFTSESLEAVPSSTGTGTDIVTDTGGTMTAMAGPAATAPYDDERWTGIQRSSMTSMVVSLDLNRLLGELVHVYYCSWGTDEYCKFLDAFWAAHHHARAFNGDDALRRRLHAQGFMSFPDRPMRLPHLVDAEVQALTQLIVLCFKLFNDESNTQGHALAKPWVQTVTTEVLTRYTALEAAAEELLSQSHEKTELMAFRESIRDAYTSPVAITLRSVAQMRPALFKQSAPWLLPLLSDLTMVSDPTVRRCNKEVLDALVLPLALNNTDLLG
jgi:hypothetical protein